MQHHNDRKLKEILQEMVEVYKLKNKLHQTKIRKVWSEMMGTTINSFTKEIKLRRKKIYITIESAPLRQELNYSKEKIKKVLNEELGESYIEEVIIR
jgi:predicted nucleic acid-binding Zn ribbon protein